MKYIIQDTEGNSIASFNNFSDAINAKAILYQRPDWRIVRKSTDNTQFRQSTSRQRAAVSFCENLDFPEFTGNLGNFYDCSSYLTEYLEQAKSMYQELSCEYEAYVQELD